MLPSLFVSHGAPTLMIEDGAAQTFLRQLGGAIERRYGRPRGILCVSAHWDTALPTVTASPRPETIHDFYGFPEALYRLTYPAPGAPALAARVVRLLADAGVKAASDDRRGLDHGAWAPLSLMWPAADIPVVQLSVQSRRDAAQHWALGRALAPLRQDGVLILASGGAVHNIRDLIERGALAGGPSPTPPWASAFADWLAARLLADDLPALLDWHRQAPDAAQAHPSDEHFLPLFVALGAAGESARAERLHAGFDKGSLAMDAYSFGAPRADDSRSAA